MTAWISIVEALSVVENAVGREAARVRLREVLEAGGIRATAVAPNGDKVAIEADDWTRYEIRIAASELIRKRQAGAFSAFDGVLSRSPGAQQTSDSRLSQARLYRADLETKLKGHSEPKSRRGRRPSLDWKAVEQEVVRLMDYHGEFSADDSDWDCQARLEESVTAFCSDKLGAYPEESTVRGHVADFVGKWRDRGKG